MQRLFQLSPLLHEQAQFFKRVGDVLTVPYLPRGGKRLRQQLLCLFQVSLLSRQGAQFLASNGYFSLVI